MAAISKNVLLEQLEWRYATKKFDVSRAVSDEDWKALEMALILTPSSFGLQPWKFLIVTNSEVRDRLVAVSWDQSQVVECSHYVIFAVRTELGTEDIDSYLATVASTRNLDLHNPSLVGLRKMLLGFTSGPNFQAKNWATLQVYIALGNLMTSAALLGIDTCPLEGIDPTKYDEILGLCGSGYGTVVACAVGYRAGHDKHATLAKVRFPASRLVQHID